MSSAVRPDPAAAGGPSPSPNGFARLLSERLGGPLGRHAGPARWWHPARVVLLVATGTYLLGVVWRRPCRITAPGQAPDWFQLMCYSDIPLLYEGRGLLAGNTPYLDSGDYPVLEYPVLTGWFLELERRIALALGAPSGTGLSEQAKIDSTLTFVDVNTVLLGGLFLLTVWAQLRTVPGRPWDAILVAASPCVAAAALINWDLLPVALTAVGLMLWSGRRPAAAGVLLGLAAAAKLYPLFLLGPLLLLCLRAGRMRAYGEALAGFVAAWLAVNLPVIVFAPRAWLEFWTFNADRGGDLGSIWYVLSLAGVQVPALNALAAGLFLVGCAGVGALILLAPRRPRLGAVCFLVLVAFLMTNKVYSPQYMLWLLPLLVLATPRWRDWVVFTAGELVYFGAIWWHLGGFLVPYEGAPDRLYWLAVLLRLTTQGFVAAVVVRDALRPERDVVRRGGGDDPAGGVVDGVGDVGWLARWRPGPR